MLKFSAYSYLIRGQPEEKFPVKEDKRGWTPFYPIRAHKAQCTGGAAAAVIDFGRGRCPDQAVQHQARGLRGDNDARTGMPFGIPKGAMCVQRFDDSLNSAIRITYRISLRSSSMPEPRDPLLKVLL